MEMKEVIEKTRKVIKDFEKREPKKWTPEIMITELVKQVGGLSKQIMMLEQNYVIQRNDHPQYSYSKEQLADELSDILFMIIRIADFYKIDLEKSHLHELDLANKWFEENK
jgi:NTP pyrophosphatase (non-canonical NTP hydrolase)